MDNMDPDQFDTWFKNDGGAPFPMDNAMLDSSASGTAVTAAASEESASASGSSRGRAPPPPRTFCGPETATAVMTGQPEPVTNVYEITTSCSDSSSDGDECEDGITPDDHLQRTLDDLFDGPTESSSAAAAAAAAAGGPSSRRKKRRRHRPRHRMECFGCTISMAGTKGEADGMVNHTHMQTMQRMFNDLAPRMEKWTVARLLHAYYKETVYKPGLIHKERDSSVPVPVKWHTVEIYEHFYQHSYAPEVWLLNQIAEYEALSRMLYLQCAAKTDGGSGAEPCERIIAAKLRVDAHIRALRKEPLDDHNFRSGEGGMDVHSAGAAFAPFRAWKR